jgi:hypothetical protein
VPDAYTEGHGLLCDDPDDVSIRVRTHGQSDKATLAFNGSRKLYPLDQTNAGHCSVPWPPVLQKARKMRLSVHCAEFSFDNLSPMNWALWHLHYYLLGCKAKHEEVIIEVEGHLSSAHDALVLSNLLEPVKFLARVIRMEVGEASAKFEKCFAMNMKPLAEDELAQDIHLSRSARLPNPSWSQAEETQYALEERFRRYSRFLPMETLQERTFDTNLTKPSSLPLLWLSAALASARSWQYMTVRRDRCLQILLLAFESLQGCSIIDRRVLEMLVFD